ncbi:Sugar phosphate isomerase/epimerase [Micromonospora pattaloongensis]|uniref:Sugar phosphate isomerase/epimerase n=1 Tax=Micromonospora pattaloongensis TaxID=405436 RepID=A0A1H3NM00_9ACTN|nr:sugar phosphate isomerase/epimerase [Micromonospora pattaloongensis]SDY89946.1 Sugar phosphate isomerase/epimerase [Micromonospora pattaloongensis]
MEHDDHGRPPQTDPSLSRRGIFRAATVGAAALGAGQLLSGPAEAAPAATGHSDHGRRRVPTDRISIQLYTLRDQLAIDLPGTLAALRRIGYTRVEHAGFVGRTAAQFRAALDAAGLRATSGHASIPQPFDDAAWQTALADARTVGCRYLVHPWFGLDANGEPIRDPARYRALARDLNRAGALARRAGIQFGYHNHQLEFVPLNGERRTGFDILTAETDPRLVHFELDLFWAIRGAHDPVDVIHQHRGRIKQVHVKDMNVNAGFDDLGRGLIDFGRIFAHAQAAGLDEYIVERDDAGTPPRTPADALSTARVGYDYLTSLRF